MTAQIAQGYNNTPGLADVAPQPHMSGLLYVVIMTLGDTAYRDGRPITRWSYGVLRPSQFAAIRSALGLSDSVKTAEVTLRTLTNDFSTFANYNAKAIDPEPDADYRYEGGRFLDVVFTFQGLAAL